MQLILISNPENFCCEHELLRKFFNAGLEYFHLRKPGYSIEDYINYIELVPEKYHKNIVVHNYIDLYSEYNLKGIHFSRHNKYRINEFEQAVIQKSISAHSFDELLNLQEFNYAFLSPVYNSISKKNYKSMFNPEEIAKFFKRNILDTRVIALGGISYENTEKTLLIGFDGVAVMGSLWNNYFVEKNIETTVRYFIELNKKCQQFVRMY